MIIARLSSAAIDPSAVLRSVYDPECGAVDLFVGLVRDLDGGRDVTALAYEAHPMAGEILTDLVQEITEMAGVVGVAAVHRVGLLAIGDVAVVCAVSAPHRGQAFDACRLLIDRLKNEVPIWKKQTFTDGTDEWVGAT